MLSGLIARALRLPAARRRLWRSWYGFIVERDGDSDWTFMNYGYRSDPPLELAAEQEPDRWCIQLYDHLTATTSLSGRDVLEVGSGRGGGAAWVHSRHAPRALVGVDYTPANVRYCRRRHVAPGLSFLEGDAEALPFDDGSFDVVLNLESSHCYGSRARFYREAYRVLRPGGQFEHADLFDPADAAPVRTWLAAAGFESCREEDITARVLEAMELDDARKRALIAARCPGWLGGLFGDFAGLRGTTVHRGLERGGIVYRHFGLRRPGQA